jgi:hypothetical protein
LISGLIVSDGALPPAATPAPAPNAPPLPAPPPPSDFEATRPSWHEAITDTPHAPRARTRRTSSFGARSAASNEARFEAPAADAPAPAPSPAPAAPVAAAPVAAFAETPATPSPAQAGDEPPPPSHGASRAPSRDPARPKTRADGSARRTKSHGSRSSRTRGGARSARAEPAPSFVVQADRAARWRRPWVRLSLALAALLAAAGLAAQVVYVHRDRIAASDPAWRGLLQEACAVVGCQIGEYHHIDALSVESSALVRAERAPYYRLSVTLRNRSANDVALPAIDLVVNDAQGQPIARRVLTMAALGVRQHSLKAGGELPIQASLAVAERAVSGYTVEIFYP